MLTEGVTTSSTPKSKKKAAFKKKLTPTKKKLATKKKLWRPFHVMLLYFDTHSTCYACVLPPVMLLCGPRHSTCYAYFQNMLLYFQNHVILFLGPIFVFFRTMSECQTQCENMSSLLAHIYPTDHDIKSTLKEAEYRDMLSNFLKNINNTDHQTK